MNGGNGYGTTGGTSTTGGCDKYNGGGCGSFGQGGSGYLNGGGAGYYGGGGYQLFGGGGGGSGYCNTSLGTCSGSNGVREGDGYAKISW